MLTIQLRFYEELNDFLPREKRKISFFHSVTHQTTIKDLIESLGVPHTEVDLILVNGKSVNFSYLIQNEDYISVYPVFETLDISELTQLRAKPLRKARFILDVHLGKLAKYLRLLGFDTVYENDFSDEIIALRSKEEKRIVLTRDVGLLKNKSISHGYWMRHTDPKKQVEEVLKRFSLTKQCHPFTRCLNCNGLLKTVKKNKIIDHIPPLARQYHDNFMQCQSCKKIYWEGSHYMKLKKAIEKLVPDCG
ncbi:Mut7-C RNAse domain-containing protein [Legionella micdadei]|uniref:Uncharacterized protein n=1 Tax=Legionella micdadei TaxID=451 RepID=A0A098GHM0_LEGMI|nr:Mut7-C RNAse domain-containing protein [Legionella micdadei]ARG96662.1 twitching motility protein PilT [Legionella micdadei]ARG99409.1 twitching motility protein PilT [Legionella micdadei]KTD26325.1 hypothetical protein Lmic_2419 [Legionella micdadei]NSL19099.1 Mut7-C ubiquitin/RNAse domain-containing protein [Legionella micdadei]CEG61964.1 conserved protein of unknown function [Legionella micdadei]